MNRRKAWVHIEPGAGFRVDLFRNWDGDTGEAVTAVWCKDESSALATAEAWEQEGRVI